MNRHRILLALPDAPLPFGNAAARSYFVLLHAMAQRGYRATALAACESEEEALRTRQQFKDSGLEIRCYPRREPPSLRGKWKSVRQPFSYIYDQAFVRDFEQEMCGEVAVLHLEQLWSGWLGLRFAAKAVLNVHYSFGIDLAGKERDSVREWMLRHRSRRCERFLLRRYSYLNAVSEPLRYYLQTINPSARTSAVPVGIDTDLYPYVERRTGYPFTFGLIGSFSWHPSYIAGWRLLSRLWPRIRRAAPGSRLLIAGRDARARFSEFLNEPDVEIVENVLDIEPYFRRVDVLVYAPEHGSGMKVKVQEAFAYGTSVVTTPAGVEGLPALNGVHAAIVESDHELVERAVALASDDNRRIAQCRAARRLVEERYSPGAIIDGWEAVYERIAYVERKIYSIRPAAG